MAFGGAQEGRCGAQTCAGQAAAERAAHPSLQFPTEDGTLPRGPGLLPRSACGRNDTQSQIPQTVLTPPWWLPWVVFRGEGSRSWSQAVGRAEEGVKPRLPGVHTEEGALPRSGGERRAERRRVPDFTRPALGAPGGRARLRLGTALPGPGEVASAGSGLAGTAGSGGGPTPEPSCKPGSFALGPRRRRRS